MKKTTFLSCFLQGMHVSWLISCLLIALATLQTVRAATNTAVAAGAINVLTTWSANSSIALPVDGDANIWSTGTFNLNTGGASITFYGGTFDVVIGGNLDPTGAGTTLTMKNLNMNGGIVYSAGGGTGNTIDLQNNILTLNSGAFKTISNGALGRNLSIKNAVLAGNGTITISQLNAGTYQNYVELNTVGVTTTGFTGIFVVAPGLSGTAAGGMLKLNEIATPSFGISIPVASGSVASNGTTYTSSVSGKLYFTPSTGNTVKLTSLNLGGTAIAPGTYTLAQLNDYGGAGTKTAYLNQSSTGTITVELAAPTAVTATNVNGVASVAFAGSASSFEVTPYNVTTSTAGTPVIGTASPILVPGLAAGNNYTFTVTATTAGSTSSASIASNEITISAPGTVTAVAAGAINVLATWSADNSIPLPVAGDANTWYSNSKILSLATNNYTFNGGTLLLNAANFTPTINNLFLNNFTMTGGVVYPSVIGNCTFDLQNKTFTLSGGKLGTVSSGAAGRALIFQNCSLAGSGNITVYQLNSGAYENWVEFKSSVNTSGFTGTFNVVPGTSGTSIGGELKLNDIATASFSVNIPASTGTGTYTSSVPGKLYFTGTVNLVSLKLGNTDIAPGTYTLSQLNAYSGGDLSAYLNQTSTGSVLVSGAVNTPTIGAVTPGNANASVAFTHVNTAGYAVTYTVTPYNVTTSTSGTPVTGITASPAKITGLTNGHNYTFTVTATNTVGVTSAESAASTSVAPNATSYIIPVSSNTDISALTLTPVSDVEVVKDVLLNINQSSTINSLTIAAGGQVTNASTLNAGTLILNSNQADGTATYIDNGTTNVTSAIANQYLGTTRNWYVSSPVVSTASSTSNIEKYFEYIEAGNNNPSGQPSGSTAFWKGYNPGATFMEAGKGYIALPNNPAASLQFSGTLNKGDISIAISKVGNGYNLIGNPYPSHLTWTEAYVNSKSAQIEPTIWIRTNTGSVNSGGDADWSFNTYNALVNEVVPSWADVLIAPMQAFWVKAKATGSLVLNSDLIKSHHASNRLKAPAVKNTNRQRVRLQVSNGTVTDEALVYFDAAASNAYDGYDSQKMFINSASKPEIFTQTGTDKLVINGLNSIQYDTEIPLGFSTLSAGDFSISRTEFSNFESGTRIVLKDKLHPATEFELAEGNAYNFSADVTTASTDRFSLVFRAPGSTTGVENTTKLNTQVYVNAANQMVIIAPEKSNYAIYNAVGQLIENGIMNSKRETLNTKLTAGVFFVKVNNQSTRVIIK